MSHKEVLISVKAVWFSVFWYSLVQIFYFLIFAFFVSVGGVYAVLGSISDGRQNESPQLAGVRSVFGWNLTACGAQGILFRK